MLSASIAQPSANAKPISAPDSKAQIAGLRAFQLRALALRIPLFNRVARAVDLFCTPFPGSRERALRARQHLAPEWSLRSITHDGIRYQTYVMGEPHLQPFLLCSHGWASNGLAFAQWSAMAKEYDFALVCFDHSAHGLSTGKRAHFPSFVQGIAAMKAHFGEPTAAIGHSFGAAALAVSVAELALKCPLVLIAPPADIKTVIQTFLHRLALPSKLEAAFTQHLSTLVQRDPKCYQNENFASQISQRTLIIHDRDDREIPWQEGASYVRLASNAKMLATTGLGHYKILKNADVIQASIAHILGFPVGLTDTFGNP